jgi:hypothetical protein
MSPAKHTLSSAAAFLNHADALLSSGPGADDLDGMAAWISEMNAAFARLAQLTGECEAVYARLVQHELSTIEEDDLKKIKHSSTLTELWVRGKYPEAYATVAKMERMNKVFTEVLQNSRTLLASYRQEREFDLRTQIRNQA